MRGEKAQEGLRIRRKRLIGLRAGAACAVAGLALLVGVAVWQWRAAIATETDLSDMRVSFSAGEETGKFVYLSDLALDTTRTSAVAWGEIWRDKATADGAKLSLRYNGSVVPFNKGIFAHATSNLYYNLEELGIVGDYDYLTAFVGLNTTSTRGNGVIFEIHGSVDGENWTQIYNEARKVSMPGANAEFIKVGIKDYKFLRLYAYDNVGNGADHSVWADARLIKEGYDQYAVPMPESFDADLKRDVEIATNPRYELSLLRRTLIKKVGQFALTQFVQESAENRAVMEWLYNDLGAMRYYLTGGAPNGNNYVASLNVLSRLFAAHGADLADASVSEFGTRRGDLYERMMIAEALVYSSAVGSWLGGGQLSDAAARYEAFKGLYLAGKMKEPKVFESLEVEEMRWVVHAMVTDPEVAWLNYYTREVRNNVSNPYSYITYRFGYNYGKADYRSEENRAKWDEKYGLSKFGVAYGDAGSKEWMVFEEGSVCGGLSKTGASIWQSWGYPAAVIGQPAHAAYLAYGQDAEGRGYWGIGNSIAGWHTSEKSERLPLGWGSNGWDSYYQVSYVPYAQAALNDMEHYVKAFEELLRVDLYAGTDEKEAVYRKALAHEDINMDAWYGLIQLYLNDNRKVEADFVRLTGEIAEALKYYPLPMWDLTNLVKGRITTAAGQAEFARAQKESLEAGKAATEAEVYQSGVTRQMAEYLLNRNDLSVAKFSFNGENAGKIVLAEKYQEETLETVWQYSIDAKRTWSEPIREREWQLSAEEIGRITAANDVAVCVVGTKCGSAYVPGGEDASYVIDIVEQSAPTGLYANDLENRVVGTTDVMEWRYAACADEDCAASGGWTGYASAKPDLAGDKAVQVRIGANGTKLASDYRAFAFTTDVVDETKKYVPVARVALEGVSTEAVNNGGSAAFALDGNFNTRWHSAWNGTDNEKWITARFDRPIVLAAVEYVPAGGGNGKILDGEIYGSEDGTTWTKLAEVKNWKNDESVKRVEIAEAGAVKFVKIVGTRTSTAGGGNFIAARMFNFYEDATKAPAVEEPKPEEPKPEEPKPGTGVETETGGNVSGGNVSGGSATGGSTNGASVSGDAGADGASAETKDASGTGASATDKKVGSTISGGGNTGKKLTETAPAGESAEQLPKAGVKIQWWWFVAAAGVMGAIALGRAMAANRRR